MIIFLILIALCVLYLYLIAPRVPRRPLNGLEGLYAHRGLWNGERPENSLPAFRAAVEKGFGIETDVHITKDNRLVVFHDDSLKRMCGDGRNLPDCTLAELRQLRLAGTEETIPTFDEFLEAVDGKVPLVIEIKTDMRITLLCEQVNERLSRYQGPYCIESFDPRAVRWYRKHRPDIIRGQLTFGLVKPSKMPKTLLMRSWAGLISWPASMKRITVSRSAWSAFSAPTWPPGPSGARRIWTGCRRGMKYKSLKGLFQCVMLNA